MIEIEKYPCSDKRELLSREQFWIDELKPELNRIKAYGFDKKEYDKQWYHENKDYMKDYKKIARQFTKECDGLNRIVVC
jgi:hypothetical protein